MKKNRVKTNQNLIYDSSQNTKDTILRLFHQLKNQRIRLTIVGISICIYIILSIWTPFRSAVVIDKLWQSIKAAKAQEILFSITWDNVGKDLTILSIQYLFTWFFYYIQSFLMASVADTLTLSLRRQIAVKLNLLPFRFFDQNKPGEILSKVTNDLDKITETLQTGLLKLVVAIGTVIGSLAVMMYYNVILTCIFLIFMIISIIITKVVAKKNLEYAASRQETLGELTGIVEEYYTGRNIIKAYNHEDESMEQVFKYTEINRKATQRADFLTNCVNPLIRLINRLGQAVIAVIAGNAMLNGTMTIGVVQAFFQYVNQASEPLTQASYMINTLQSALASAERTFKILDSEEEIPDTLNPIMLEGAKDFGG